MDKLVKIKRIKILLKYPLVLGIFVEDVVIKMNFLGLKVDYPGLLMIVFRRVHMVGVEQGVLVLK